MRSDRRKPFGGMGERLAYGWLIAHGWRVRARNWRTARGEIDLIGEDGDTLVFVEVKTRRATAAGGFGFAGETVDRRKQRRLTLMATCYMTRSPGRACRFDVICVELGESPRIRHLRAAFP